MSPFAAFTRRSPATTPTAVLPLEFLITAPAPSSRSRTSPEPAVTSAWPAARSTATSPAPDLTRSAATSSSRTRPRPDLIRQSPSGPSLRRSPHPSEPCRLEPAGTSIVTSTEPPRSRLSHPRGFGALTSSLSCASSMRVRPAALTSSSFAGSLGRTSTTVLSRSAAMIRASPNGSSSVAATGQGVSKAAISAPTRCRPGRAGRHGSAAARRAGRAPARTPPRGRATR